MKIRQISPQEQDFTEVLCGIAHMPKMLYLYGNLPSRRLSVAIVGSRRPSRYGREVAYALAYELARAGCVVVSGMALGIDTVAHRGCLDAGGTTVAVLGTAIDQLYPRANVELAEEIVRSGGCVLSEYGSGATTKQGCFVARNRIVSGLADAVIVVEASARSGTLSTAAYALAQGRQLYAVPGQVGSVLSVGSNRLIRDGARIVTSVAECVAEITGLRVAEQTELELDGLSAAEALAEMTMRELGGLPM